MEVPTDFNFRDILQKPLKAEDINRYTVTIACINKTLLNKKVKPHR